MTKVVQLDIVKTSTFFLRVIECESVIISYCSLCLSPLPRGSIAP